MRGIGTTDCMVAPQAIAPDVTRTCLSPAPGEGIHELGGCDG
jgi:hypothetical protein